MNTEKPVKKDQKEFDTVGFMRERRTKIAGETGFELLSTWLYLLRTDFTSI